MSTEAANALKQLLASLRVPGEAAVRLEDYLALLSKWNARINLVSSVDWAILGPLFREGIWASEFYPKEASSHLDIGSGAGFPSVLLKILVPRIRLEMVESRSKKSQFLETAAYLLGLAETCVHNTRLSALLERCPPEKRWDCISWKGIKLETADILQLYRHSHAGTKIWMFHGREPALMEGDALSGKFELVRSEQIPGMNEGKLSVYETIAPAERCFT